jgi:hypothetical protein
MKKIFLSLFILLVFTFTLMGCGSNNNGNVEEELSETKEEHDGILSPNMVEATHGDATLTFSEDFEQEVAEGDTFRLRYGAGVSTSMFDFRELPIDHLDEEWATVGIHAFIDGMEDEDVRLEDIVEATFANARGYSASFFMNIEGVDIKGSISILETNGHFYVAIYYISVSYYEALAPYYNQVIEDIRF